MIMVPVVSLILVNIFPVFGALFLGWDLNSIILLYWSENIVIGLYNILKMALAQQPNVLNKGDNKKTMIGFFAFHYGAFTLGHGLFLMQLLDLRFMLQSALLMNFLFLFVSHGVSFFVNYIGKKEYEHNSPESLMRKPYIRVIIMHLTVIIGGEYTTNASGQSYGPIIALIVIKTIADLLSHLYEHRGSAFAKYLPFKNESITEDELKEVFNERINIEKNTK